MQLPMNVTKMFIIVCYLHVNKEKGHLLQFSLNLSQTSQKIVPAYIYICLFLYLPICLLSILFIDSVDDRCLFAYFYICNNCKVWISYCHKFILTPVSYPCCVQKFKKKTFAPIICKIVKVENAPLSNYLGNSTFFLAGMHHKHTWSKTAIIHTCSMLMSA